MHTYTKGGAPPRCALAMGGKTGSPPALAGRLRGVRASLRVHVCRKKQTPVAWRESMWGQGGPTVGNSPGIEWPCRAVH